MLGAKRRLASRECAAVLSDFAIAGTGQTMAAVLAEHCQAPEDYLDTLVFQDGSRTPACLSGKVLAGTRPGARVFYVCVRQFRALVERDTVEAQAVVIHELLHTLGLGEDPPTSQQITTRVLERCTWSQRGAALHDVDSLLPVRRQPAHERMDGLAVC